MKYTALEKSEFINKEMKSYIKSTFQVEDETFRNLFNNQIDDVELMKGPYISVSHPFKTGSTIRSLIDDHILSKYFLSMESLHLDRPLYQHQEEAAIKAKEGENLVISTGTGSGKTESFMIPVLNAICEDIEKGIDKRGVQAMFLYPMNALANDQRERLREILENYPAITFGFYTGETEEHERNARGKYKKENNRDPLPNELISREEIRKNPPNILFTNYSMLEYLLLRPTDKTLFEKENTSRWKYIVLDEAHVYKGALGIEISLLLKRLLASIYSEPRFILTSATLATDKEDFPAVIDFAERLTSQKFNENSVILGDRIIREYPHNDFRINPSNYSRLLDERSYVTELYNEKINKGASGNIKMIYEILLIDQNFHDFISVVNKPKKVVDILAALNSEWDEDAVIALIDLISYVNTKENLFLVDVKYHTFFKTLDGAQVTIKPSKVMYLKKTYQHKAYTENGELEFLRTFDLGVCKYCKVPYLIGRIVDNVFYKLEDEELYEQYDEVFKRGSDIVLLKDSLDESEDDVNKYELCNKCGYISDAEDLNATTCGCGSQYKFFVYKKDNDKRNYNTNINECLSCKARNNHGVIESFYIGKDSASSMIAQLLYKKMGIKDKGNISVIEENIGLFDFGVKKSIKKEVIDDRKQIITFSDSRQQASYFATYFENRHQSFLRKRLITEQLEIKKHLKIDQLLNNLEYEIDKKHLFMSDTTASKQAWISVLYDLLDIDRKYSLTGLGLVHFKPDIDFNLNEELINREFGGMKLDDFKTFVYFMIDSMRSIPAIEYFDDAKLTFDERNEYLLYRSTDKGGITLFSEKNAGYIPSVLPKTKGGNKYSKYMMKAFDLDLETTELYLKKTSQFLFEEGSQKYIVRTDQGAFRYNYKGFEVQEGSTVDWFLCDKCGTVTPFNINNVCVKGDCDGYIESCDPKDVFKNNYYYKEYLEKEIEQIRIEEHTAQLTHEKAREYQRDFKEGKINILSSSTTFEMGVDIGDLDTVYMRNVPPSPSNYIQRAGRAGRRKDTAAYVITFCSSNSHDYTYFQDPVKMIEGKITPPYFKIENKKIIYRHILSVILSEFFKINKDLFDDSGSFFDQGGIDALISYIVINKEDITVMISDNIYSNFGNEFDQWMKEMIEDKESPLMVMKDEFESSIESLDSLINSVDLKEYEVSKAERMKKQLQSTSMIQTLSRSNVIPKYGFPIDTVELEVPTSANYSIGRDLATAISEYAPESEVIVDKRKYKSRYIKTAVNREPLEYYYKVCEDCGMLLFNISKYHDVFSSNCQNCGSEPTGMVKKFIKPIYGFIAENKEVKDRSLKPKRTYSSDYYYVGNSKLVDDRLDIRDIVAIKSAEDNHLALLNESNFFTCNRCGYTEINNADAPFPTIEKPHNIPRIDMECSNSTLNSISLGHDFLTDVVIIEFKQLIEERNTLISVLFAILEGMSNALEIERSDISGIIQNLDGKQQIILFDNVPGGAGHVKRMLKKDDFVRVMKSAYQKVSQECCDETSSCYNCLRNYSNQRIHNILKRGKAKDFLEKVLGDL